MADSSRLDGRIALVTGASRGIGAAIARALAADGAALWIAGRDMAALADTAASLRQQAEASVETWRCDVTDAQSVAAFAQAVSDGPGRTDILVNNAGAAASAPFARMEEHVWRHMLDTNLTSVFRVTRAFLPLMTAPEGGRIVNVASTAGLIGMAYVTAYCAAKHGVVGLTRALAKELAGKRITVNAVCPGYTETELLAKAVAEITGKTGLGEDEARAALIHDVPIGRMIRPEEVAAAVRWLCGPDAGGVTGTAVPIAGGAVG